MTERTNSEIESLYFQWLYRHVGRLNDRNPSHSRWMLTEQMHRKVFSSYLPYDDNRAGDGLDLRVQFFESEMPDVDPDAIFGPCSVLEMLIALSHRVEYQALDTDIDKDSEAWFWELAQNGGLTEFTDDVYLDDPDMTHERVDSILERIITRRYRASGEGGFFPLQRPQQDQRKVELWYQMQDYVMEQSDILG